MPMPFVKIKNENENKIENMQINTTTNSMNKVEEKKTYTLTPLHRKTEEIKEKNKEKENKGFVHKPHEFSKMREPGHIDMLDTALVIVISSVWLEVGALIAAMARSSIAVDLAFGGLFGLVVGVTIEAIEALRG